MSEYIKLEDAMKIAELHGYVTPDDLLSIVAHSLIYCKDCIYTRNLYGRSVCKYGTCSGCILREGFFCANGTREETRKDGDDNAVD